MQPLQPPSSRLSKVMQDSHGNRDKNSHKIVGKKKKGHSRVSWCKKICKQ